MTTARLLAAAGAVAAAAAASWSPEPGRRYYSTPATLPPLLHTQPEWAWLRSSVNTTLRVAAAAAGIAIGSSLNQLQLSNSSDPAYSAIAAVQYNLVTPENECKFQPTEPSDGGYSFTTCNYTATFTARKLQGAFRGHNTVWGASNPQWLLDGGFSPSQLQTILQDHVTTLITTFGPSKFLCWDVVNEAVTDDASSPDTFKPAPPWYPAIPAYVDLAFQTAAAARSAAAPGLLLFYNDYGGEEVNTKSDKIYAMVQAMQAAGVPLDGVGLQMHISVDDYPDPTSVSANIARLGKLGLDVHVTEMDVRCTPPCGSDRLNLQAQIYGSLLQACLNNTNCRSFETWGFTDRYTWLWSFNNPNHQDVQPLPFDFNYNPKPAYYEMLAVLQAHAARKEAAAAAAARPASHHVRGSAVA